MVVELEQVAQRTEWNIVYTFPQNAWRILKFEAPDTFAIFCRWSGKHWTSFHDLGIIRPFQAFRHCADLLGYSASIDRCKQKQSFNIYVWVTGRTVSATKLAEYETLAKMNLNLVVFKRTFGGHLRSFLKRLRCFSDHNTRGPTSLKFLNSQRTDNCQQAKLPISPVRCEESSDVFQTSKWMVYIFGQAIHAIFNICASYGQFHTLMYSGGVDSDDWQKRRCYLRVADVLANNSN